MVPFFKLTFRTELLIALLSLTFLISIFPYSNADDSSKYPLHSSREFRDPKRLTLCNEPVPIDDESVWEMLDREFVISVGDKPQVVMWLKRAKRYFPYIEQRLKEKGLPDDLKYLAVIESSLRRYSFSVKGAAGPWQFMEHTAKRYDLRVDRWFDDRLNFYRSTDAAIEYLRDLYEIFGSWALSVAAYNCGEDRIKQEIKEQGVHDYYRLNLPLETERFVFRMLSAKIILSAPGKYGFHLDEDEYYTPLEFDEVWVDAPSKIHLTVIARAADSFFKEIKELNPEIQGYHLPRGKHLVKIPKGTAELFTENFKKGIEELAKKEVEKIIYTYKVKKGDTLTSIAKRFNVTVASIKKWNSLQTKRFIYPGQRLRIYTDTLK
ncbi:MAG: transglycosylase SLT domain-containing protein [Pseudomonadota bacterium]